MCGGVEWEGGWGGGVEVGRGKEGGEGRGEVIYKIILKDIHVWSLHSQPQCPVWLFYYRLGNTILL